MDVSGAAKASPGSNQCVSFILRVTIKNADTFNAILRRNDIFFPISSWPNFDSDIYVIK